MVHITKTGFECFERDGKLRKDIQQMNIQLVSYLRDAVTLVEENVTLGDIITFVAKDEILPLFIDAYCGCKVMDLYQEFKQSVEQITPEDDIQYCTVAMDVEIWPVPKQKDKKRLEMAYNFYGCGKDGQRWGLDLAPLTEIAALPFRIEANASVQYLIKDDCGREEGLEFTPSLLEILDAIFFDLSFHGNAAEKAIRLEELQENIQAIEEGKATLVPADLGKEIREQ